MSLIIELREDLGDGDFILSYDSDKSPMGFSIGLAVDDKVMMVRRIDLEKFDQLLTKLRKAFLFGCYSETEDEEDEEDEDEDD
jgi:hypothetical protein